MNKRGNVFRRLPLFSFTAKHGDQEMKYLKATSLLSNVKYWPKGQCEIKPQSGFVKYSTASNVIIYFYFSVKG